MPRGWYIAQWHNRVNRTGEPFKFGITHHVGGRIIVHANGLHAGSTILASMANCEMVPTGLLARVELSGDFKEVPTPFYGYIMAASQRTVLAMAPREAVLEVFAHIAGWYGLKADTLAIRIAERIGFLAHEVGRKVVAETNSYRGTKTAINDYIRAQGNRIQEYAESALAPYLESSTTPVPLAPRTLT